MGGFVNATVRFMLTAASALVFCGCNVQIDSADDASVAQSDANAVQLFVTVPENTPTLYITGNIDELGPWDPKALAMSGEGRSRTAIISVPQGYDLEYKFTLGSWQREAVGDSGQVLPNYRLAAAADRKVVHELTGFKQDPAVYMADWKNSGVLGTLVYWRDVASEFLSETRHVEIWLPPGYDENARQRYRVIYMSDGQNLFDPRIANTGTDWGVDEAMVRGTEAGRFDPAIVVATWSTSKRTPEYSPWHEAPQYARFLIEELMPRVNTAFRTLTDRQDTFAMGSSMGGLLSFYLVKEHPDVFSACGCVSTHFPLAEAWFASSIAEDPGDADETPYVVRDIAAGDTLPEGARLFFDYGTEGLDAQYAPVHDAVRKWLLEQGRKDGKDFLIRAYPGADHNEAAWRARLGDQLQWLLGDPAK